MADPKISYVVSIYDVVAKVWRTILTTRSKDEAEAILDDIGDMGRIEEIKLRPKRKR